MRALVAGIILALSCGVAAAENAGDIEVDRPDVTNSTATVGAGVFQLETGVEYARTSAAGSTPERRVALQMTARTGLTDRLELRLEGEPIVGLRGGEDATGVGDLTVGLKYRVLDTHDGGAALGVPPFVTLPVAEAGQSRRDGFLLQGLASASLSRDVTTALSAFVELFWASPDGRGGRHTVRADAGVVWTVTSDVAIDVALAPRSRVRCRTTRSGRA